MGFTIVIDCLCHVIKKLKNPLLTILVESVKLPLMKLNITTTTHLYSSRNLNPLLDFINDLNN